MANQDTKAFNAVPRQDPHNVSPFQPSSFSSFFGHRSLKLTCFKCDAFKFEVETDASLLEVTKSTLQADHTSSGGARVPLKRKKHLT